FQKMEPKCFGCQHVTIGGYQPIAVESNYSLPRPSGNANSRKAPTKFVKEQIYYPAPPPHLSSVRRGTGVISFGVRVVPCVEKSNGYFARVVFSVLPIVQLRQLDVDNLLPRSPQ